MKIKVYTDKTVAISNWCNRELQEALNHLKIAASKIESDKTLYVKIEVVKEKRT